MLATALLLAGRRQTYTKIGYLLATLPLGICYFTLITTGLSISIGMLVLIIGFLISVLFLRLWWWLAAFERMLVIRWLNVDVPPMEVAGTKPDWTLQSRLSNPVTWKSLAYLLLEFPFGIFAFVIVIAMFAFVFALGLPCLVIGILIAPFFCCIALIREKVLTSDAAVYYLLRAFTCFGVLLLPLFILDGMATLWGQFARVCLGMSDQAIQLAEATATAARERARAEQADAARRALIVNASHELRTPVASIRGHIESLLATSEQQGNQSLTPEMLHNYLTIVHRESLHLGTLVDDLLSLARSETDSLRLNMAAVDVGEVVEEVYQALMPLARRERQITLLREVKQHIPHVMADRQRLLQILSNLVRNAITYTPDGGIVSIAACQANAEHVTLSVADTGIGIAPEEQQHIFERFYRTDASRARSSGGFGLGLAIVHDLVTAMGGSIRVQSVVGEGSCFIVLLSTAHAKNLV
jgi:two-component system, OmpR family, phosphate regulon sensor histidine kinase PhoR